MLPAYDQPRSVALSVSTESTARPGACTHAASEAVGGGFGKIAFGEAALIAQSNAPLLVVHGELDTAVPVAQGREVYAASKVTAKRLLVLPGVGHNGALAAPATLDALIELASTVLASLVRLRRSHHDAHRAN